MTSKYNHLRIWLLVFVMLNKACNMSARNLQLIYYPLMQLLMQCFDWTTSTSAARDENTFIIFWVMKQSAFVIYFLLSLGPTAKRLLCLDALKSTPTMRSCHISHMHTSVSRQKAGYCVYMSHKIGVRGKKLGVDRFMITPFITLPR